MCCTPSQNRLRLSSWKSILKNFIFLNASRTLLKILLLKVEHNSPFSVFFFFLNLNWYKQLVLTYKQHLSFCSFSVHVPFFFSVVVQTFLTASVKMFLYHKNNRLDIMFWTSVWEVRFGNSLVFCRRRARLQVF